MLGHYTTLLSDFHKTVRFIFNHPNRSLARKTGEEQQLHKSLLKRECDNILNEIERLVEGKDMQEQRVKNVMDLVFSTLNVTETETTIQQGWVMQQYVRFSQHEDLHVPDDHIRLSYVTMAFLPATFVSTLFGMNLEDVGPCFYLVDSIGSSVCLVHARVRELTQMVSLLGLHSSAEHRHCLAHDRDSTQDEQLEFLVLLPPLLAIHVADGVLQHLAAAGLLWAQHDQSR